MGFLSSIKSGFSSVVKAAKSGVKDSIKAVDKAFSSVSKPIASAGKVIYDKVIDPAYNNIVKPAANKVVQEIGKQLDRVDNVLDKTSSGLGSLLGNPFMTIIVGVGAIVVLNAVISRK